MKTIYGSKDIDKVNKNDEVRILRIISSDAFLKLLKKQPSKIEISKSVLRQMKRIESIVKAIEITKKYSPKIVIIGR